MKGVFGWTAFDHLVHVDHVFLEDTILLLSIFAGQMGEFADSGRKFKSNSFSKYCWGVGHLSQVQKPMKKLSKDNGQCSTPTHI